MGLAYVLAIAAAAMASVILFGIFLAICWEMVRDSIKSPPG
jgi:hypothetical protein